jgi:hypothetical protein
MLMNPSELKETAVDDDKVDEEPGRVGDVRL